MIKRQPDGRGSRDAVRRAVVTATALSAPGQATGPADPSSGNAGQMNGGTWLSYGRFDVTPFSAFTFADRPRHV